LPAKLALVGKRPQQAVSQLLQHAHDTVGCEQATSKLPASYQQATSKLPASYQQATNSLLPE
jgi:hypothetical protein